MFLASWDNGLLAEALRLLKSLPAENLPDIKSAVDRLLSRGDDETYRRFLELYRELDQSLMRDLALHAVDSDDAEVREAGEDALGWLAGG